VSAPPATWPTFDVVEIAMEAAERAGIEFRSGYALRTARRSLELLSINWANRGLNLWTIEGPDTIDLEAGVEQYTLPDDTVDLIEHVVRTWNGDPANPSSTYTDLPLDRMTLPEYAAIPNKLAPGRPTILNMRREIHPYFMVWMVPPATPVYQLVYWRLRRMQSVGSGGAGQPEIPWRFIPAMIAGLAYYLALKSKEPLALQKVPLLKAEYEEEFTLAADEDRDRATFRFVPGGYEQI
jgi:hypothetical protein